MVKGGTQGGRRHKSKRRRGRGSRGGSMARTLQKAIVPFGLFLASKKFQTKKRRKSKGKRGKSKRR